MFTQRIVSTKSIWMAALLALWIASPLVAQEPSVKALLATVRYAPQSKAAALAIERLAGRGPAGWNALGKIVRDFAARDESVALLAARALVADAGEERSGIIEATHRKVKIESVRRVLASEREARRQRFVELEAERIFTRDGKAVIRGTVQESTTLEIGGTRVQPDEHQRFTFPLTLRQSSVVEVIAKCADGSTQRIPVSITIDAEPPSLELVGRMERIVGKQTVAFKASEPLAYVWIGKRVYPAAGKEVQAVLEIGEGKRPLKVRATDLAGNVSQQSFPIEAINRVLRLDGHSAVLVPMSGAPERFTLECWARGAEPRSDRAVASFIWDWSGAALFWYMKNWDGLPKVSLPHGLIYMDWKYQAVPAKGVWGWNQWTHLALSYDGTTARFFVNGKLQAKQDGTSFNNHTKGLYVGGAHCGGQVYWRFLGELDEVRLSSVPRYCEDFEPQKYFCRDSQSIVLLHFDTDTDETFHDDSGQNHHGKRYGSPKVVAVRR